MRKNRNSFFTESNSSYMGYNNPGMMGPMQQPFQNANPYYNGISEMPINQNDLESRFAKIERQLNRLEHRINKLETTSNITNDDYDSGNTTNMYML